MKKLFGRRTDPTTQEPRSFKANLLPPLEFAASAPAESAGSLSSPLPTSDPFTFPPRDPVHGRSWPHDGWQPEPAIPHVVTPPVWRGHKISPFDFPHGPAQSFGPNFPSTTGVTIGGIPSEAYGESPPRDAEPVPVFRDTPPTLTNRIRKLPRPPISGAPDREPSPRPAPVPGSLPSGLLGFPNRPQLSSEFTTPLGIVGPTSDITTASLSETGTPLPRLRRSRTEH